MHTEEEAKKLWCPHIRLVQGRRLRNEDIELRAPSCNQVNVYAERAGLIKTTCCIASACSQWRWLERYWIDPEEDLDPPVRYSTKHKDGMQREPAKGYCGLAGRP